MIASSVGSRPGQTERYPDVIGSSNAGRMLVWADWVLGPGQLPLSLGAQAFMILDY